jgi:predicted PurR-regulated permease PerM
MNGILQIAILVPSARADMMSAVSSRPTARTVLEVTLTVAAVIGVLYLLYLLRRPIAWLVIATFAAVALSGPVNRLSRRMPRGLAIAVTFIAMLLIPVAILAILIPPIVREGSKLIDELPRYASDLQEWVRGNEQLRDLDEEYDITTRLQEEARELPQRAGDAAQWLGDLGLGLVNSAFAGVTIFILAIFIVANGRRWVDALLALQPPERAARVRPTLDRMAHVVGAYIAGALFQAAVAGITTYVVLLILGVPFAAPLAVLVALFDLIPMVGATIAAVFVGVITLFADFPIDTIVWTIWAIIYQQLENNVIQPRIQNRAVGVHPLAVIVAVLFGGTLFGVPGAILAVPVAASLQIVLKDWWAWKRPAAAAAAPPAPPPPTAPPGSPAPQPSG